VPEVHIENLVGTAYLAEKNAAGLDLGKLYSILYQLDLSLKLKGQTSNIDSVEYNSEKFAAIIIRLRKPPASIKIFRNWTITCIGCNKKEDLESAVKAAVELIKAALSPETIPLKSQNVIIEISNVVCSSNIEQMLGCGLIQKAFPDNKVGLSNFGGGSYNLKLNGGSIRVFAGGKIIGIGFKDIDLAKKTVLEAVQTIRQTLNEHGDEDRGAVCRIERFAPTSEDVVNFSRLLGVPEDVKAKAIDLIREYCQKVTKEAFGGKPKSFAAAAIYIASILCDRRLTQSRIGETVGITEVSIRNARNNIVKVLGMNKNIL